MERAGLVHGDELQVGQGQGHSASIRDGADERASADGLSVEFDVDEVGLSLIGGERDQASAAPHYLDMVGHFSFVDGDLQLALARLASVN